MTDYRDHLTDTGPLCRWCELQHVSDVPCPPVLPAGTEWDQ